MSNEDQREEESKFLQNLIHSNRLLAEIIKKIEDVPVTDDLKDKKQKLMKDFIERFLDLNEMIYKNMFGEPKIKIQ